MRSGLMPDYVVEGGFIKFSVTLSNNEDLFVEIPEEENPEAAIASFITKEEQRLEWLKQLNQG